MIDRKFAVGLTASEEDELAKIRADIAAADHDSPRWRAGKAAAAAIDAELADLRREIEALPERGV